MIENKQSGQSLIETIGAIFILTMALTTALGLTVYALSRSAISQQEIIATNLAREGIDVVRSMRDSNWLAGAVSADTTYNLSPCADIADQPCFPKTTLGPNYNLSVAGNYNLTFDTSTKLWSLNTLANHNIYVQPATGNYGPLAFGNQNYARMINISYNFGGNFPAGNTYSNGEMVIKAVVAWRGKNCVEFDNNQNLLTLVSSCKVVTEEHLTNWKDYR